MRRTSADSLDMSDLQNRCRPMRFLPLSSIMPTEPKENRFLQRKKLIRSMLACDQDWDMKPWEFHVYFQLLQNQFSEAKRTDMMQVLRLPSPKLYQLEDVRTYLEHITAIFPVANKFGHSKGFYTVAMRDFEISVDKRKELLQRSTLSFLHYARDYAEHAWEEFPMFTSTKLSIPTSAENVCKDPTDSACKDVISNDWLMINNHNADLDYNFDLLVELTEDQLRKQTSDLIFLVKKNIFYVSFKNQSIFINHDLFYEGSKNMTIFFDWTSASLFLIADEKASIALSFEKFLSYDHPLNATQYAPFLAATGFHNDGRMFPGDWRSSKAYQLHRAKQGNEIAIFWKSNSNSWRYISPFISRTLKSVINSYFPDCSHDTKSLISLCKKRV